tara:strand:- start:634 stop:3129 length:2496 start_codon:yes stop_codon:yes gene_type:complete
MVSYRVILAVISLLSAGLVGCPAWALAQQPPAEPVAEAEALARFVEHRASSTSFADLESFGERASARNDREGLNRLYHVTWTLLNQGEFERASAWNRRLAEAARARRDERYVDIATLNALAIRYDKGEVSVAPEMADYVITGRDWFVRAHAARLAALSLIDQGRVGDGLQLLTRAQADIPDRAPFADTARAGIWEVVGMGLKDIDDVEGATDAFRKFEIDYSNPAYPRPDFDSLYNLTKMAVRMGDLEHARSFAAAHNAVATRSDLPAVAVYDAALCALVADASRQSGGVLDCLKPYGEGLGDAAFLALDVLPPRAMARARTGDVAGARRDLEALRRLEPAAGGGSRLREVQSEILLAQGRPAEAFALIRAYTADQDVAATRSFAAGVHQVTGDMQQQLAARRAQLDSARARTRLQWLVIAVGVIFLITVMAGLAWQVGQGRKLKAAQERAEAANRSKSEFLANMSHEIRTPLNGVVSMADALSRRDLDSSAHQMVELIRSSGATLGRLLTDILDSAKIEAGHLALEATVFDLKHTVNDIALLWRSKAEDQGLALVFELDPAAPKWVEGDAVRLRQILTNLVSNALKFTDRGTVTLSVSAEGGDRIGFSVRDTGIGFDAEQKARIFQRFEQADGSITRRFGGTGLGLAISTALVDLMGGVLDCDSVPGQGAVFTFEIDLPQAEPTVAAPVPAANTAEIAEQPLRILLADDHPANRKVIEIMLAATAMELVTVENGSQALDAFVEGEFDLVLMDMQMPVMDGLTATQAIRAFEATRGGNRAAILMLTANAMAEHVTQSLAAGADGHLTKPITLAALFTAMTDALSGSRQEAA